ncbi:MAG TPA: Rne/Rng family ribonuclease [Desulfuromonadales bacterium]|nr:Rne/Rng family ribonuclease [Desulfuromonadales bacterium]
MTKKMLINATHPEENRVAIVEDGILTELDIEIAGKEQTKGNIYKAVVVRVEPGLQAAFVDYGAERLGFLQMGDLHPSLFKANEDKGRPRITDILRRGQELLVQVVKEERGTKGAALTTFLSLPGRFMVLMPDSDTKGVSRKIEDESQRKKLKAAMASLDLPEHMGYIVRTAGIGQTNEELKRDFDYLVRVWDNLQTHAGQVKAPALIYKESNLVIRSIRDYFSADMDEVLVDDPKVCQEAKDFFQQVMPEFARLVKLHQERRPIFSRYQIEEQIETIVKNKVPLPSGGSIVIDSTEALVAVDVNSGKMAGEQGVEGTAYKTNLEAAEEVGRQLRLRDLGGLIVIDFIDMRDRKHIREVEKRLKDALKNDKARVTIGKISQFGMLEMSRQRIKAALAEGSYLPCPHCQGSGRIKNVEAQTVAFLRKIHGGIAKGQVGRIEGEIPLEVATYLLNTKREELLEMERRHQVSIFVKGRPDFIAGQMELSFLKREKEETPPAEYVEAGAPAPQPEPRPAPPQVEKPADVAVELETAEDAAKKKRKRKRKKKGTAEEGGSETAVAVLEEERGEAATEAPVSAAATAAEEETAPEAVLQTEPAAGGSVEEGGKKKRKRRRKKKKGEAEGVAIEPAATATEPAVAAAETGAVETSEAFPGMGTADEERAKKKRRRRKKKKPAAGIPVEAAASEALLPTSTPSQPMEEAAASVPAGVELPAAEARPKRRPGRPKPAAKGAEAAPEAAAAGVAEVPKDTSAVSSLPSAESPAKPATKPRKRTPRAKPGAAEAPPAPADSGEGAPEPAAPKRRAPRRKAAETAKEEQEA